MILKQSYSTKSYPFRELFCDLIVATRLEYLHECGGFQNMNDKPGGKGSVWHDTFYSKMRGSEFMIAYNEFIAKELSKIFYGKIVYQKFPTLRIQIPNNKGVSDYHTDVEYNHPNNETNVWLPITDAKDTASIYIESEPDKKDYKPQTVKYGQYISFLGGVLSHGNEVNLTGKTRISIDMRIIPLAQFKPSKLKGLAYGKVRDIKGRNSYYGII